MVCLRFVLVALSARRRIEGILVADVASGGSATETTFKRLGDALSVLRGSHPKSWNRLLAHAPRIMLSGAQGTAAFNPAVSAVYLDIAFVDRRTTEELAGILVHEATHAYLWSLGIGYDPHERERVEAICIAAHRRFLEQTGATRELERLDKVVERGQWWSDEKNYARKLRRLKAEGAPRWLLRLLLAWGRFKGYELDEL